ncbi:MAG: Fur family transcriptional regulator [Planctomycetota bacterium]|jgi:Fur family ferric uptake transcriptional regulator
MKLKEKLAQHVQNSNLRWTHQRQMIIDAFIASKQHLTTEELFEIVRQKNPDIGYATVSRTLHLLVDAGICSLIDISDGSMRYEITFGHEHHDHLICTQCGRFIEVFSQELEEIQTSLVRKHGFLEHSHKLQIFGLCPVCQKNQSTSKTDQ